ncbi:hypothetical protein MPER_05739, partial [Moniliophthora perniciosa FA553]
MTCYVDRSHRRFREPSWKCEDLDARDVVVRQGVDRSVVTITGRATILFFCERVVMGESCKTRVILVGIGGATCSGKTTLAKHLNRILPNSVIIHQD